MELHRHRVSTSIRTEGGLLPSDLLAKIAAVDRDVPGLSETDFGLESGDRVREAITRSWNRLVGAWAALGAARVAATNDRDPLTSPTRERWLLPLFEELGFGRLPTARAIEIEGTLYPISHGWMDRVPIHLVGFGIELDRRTPGVRGAAGAAPHALVQEYLNRSDAALWGIVSNGRLLRLLRDSTSLTRQAFVEFDLEAIFEGELYADFALLWSVCHRTRFEGAKPEDCLLERWSKKAADDGTRALDQLRGGVEKAIETFGAGFLAHPSNGALREALRSGELNRQDYYRELLRLVYRLIFLFTAEDRRDETTGRELLLDPAAPDAAAERYRRFYSTARLRAIAGRRRGTRHPDLWVSLRRVITAIGGGGAPTLAIPALGSFLFGPTACPHLDGADLRNEDLLDAVRALATIEEDRRLRLVDYRNLGAEELGGIYEGLLELHPRIEVEATPPRFTLGTAAGNERKATGSYYTPSILINCLLDSALDPVAEEAVRGKDPGAAERAILELAVVDPAAGSGHFLVASAHRLAKRLASIRTGEGEPAPSAVRRALRDVIAHCIYAVDINPMAVELCKVGLWLEALEPGRPLSFLDAHIKCGNSLLGATPDLVAQGIPDMAFEPIEGDIKPVASSLRARNSRERTGQLALGEAPISIDLTHALIGFRAIEAMPEETPAQIEAKAAEHARQVSSGGVGSARLTADLWCAAFVMTKTHDAEVPTTAAIRQSIKNARSIPEVMTVAVASAAVEFGFFHWALEFPVVMARGGFDVVLGNPPWAALSPDRRVFFAQFDPTIRGLGKDGQDALVDRLLLDPAIETAWASYRRRLLALVHFLKNARRFTLYAPGNLGKGDFNIYRPFVELALRTCRASGRAGQVVPSGLYNGSNTSAIRQYMFDDCVVMLILGFDNERRQWFDVSVNSVCVYVARPGGRTLRSVAAFGIATEADALRLDDRLIDIDVDELRRQAPSTYALSEVVNALEHRIVQKMQTAWASLGDSTAGPPHRHFLRELDMGTDRHRFNQESGLPVYEGRMIDRYDYRAKAYREGHVSTSKWDFRPFGDPEKSICPQWRVLVNRLPAKLGDRPFTYRIGYAKIADPRSSRSVVATLIPPNTVCGDSVPTVTFAEGEDWAFPLFLAVANSFVFDFVARTRLNAKNLVFSIFDSLPFPRIEPGDRALETIAPLALKLACTGPEMRSFWNRMSQYGWAEPLDDAVPPGLILERDRETAEAQIDAVVARDLYGLARAELEYILDSFEGVREEEVRRHGEYRSKRLVLGQFDSLGPPLTRKGAARPAIPTENPIALGSRPGPIPGRGASNATLRAAASEVADAESAQVSLDLVFSKASEPAWIQETIVKPASLVLGMRVRHRLKGEGTLLTVKLTGRGGELLIRFDAGGEHWMVLGYGLLEFAASDVATPDL